MNWRPVISFIFKMLQGYLSVKLTSRYKCIGWILSITTFIFVIRPYLEMIEVYAIPVGMEMLTYAMLIIGSFAGAWFTHMKRYAEVYEKTQVKQSGAYIFATFFSWLVAALGTVWICGYATNALGLEAISTLSYPVMALIISTALGGLCVVITHKYAGDPAIILWLDFNGDGKVDSKDATAAIGAVADGVKDVVGAVEDAIKK